MYSSNVSFMAMIPTKGC